MGVRDEEPLQEECLVEDVGGLNIQDGQETEMSSRWTGNRDELQGWRYFPASSPGIAIHPSISCVYFGRPLLKSGGSLLVGAPRWYRGRARQLYQASLFGDGPASLFGASCTGIATPQN